MESRQSLIAWVNDLLQTSYTKVEQFGTGAAYCQILDSIYGDVRLDRVKFDANQEYEYMENFKIFQNTLAKHKVDKPLDALRLMKCRFQDNFELIQWLKRFWDMNFPGTGYDAVERRKGKPAGPLDHSASHRPMSSASSARSSSAGAYRARPGGSSSRPVGGGRPAAAAAAGAAGRIGAQRAGIRAAGGANAGAGASAQQMQELTRQLAEAKVLIDTAEKERDFYFSKLREIEVFIQQAELAPGSEVDAMAKHIQAVLYSTDESAVDDPDADVDAAMDDSAAAVGDGAHHHHQYSQQTANSLHVDEEETF
ncbi:microtubule integrity protein mal3 [Coemansia sp. RSA 1939]|nr:microtubule integrity protein mal3 [Coemansia sp. RSA 1939]KAJ2604389.1 microtubule integrity protein mal3 [Coemansia sp. RSA 1804]KAJ2680321.1 microtubule integrity protein mal3 [Coemansia sp. RSA 1285]